MQIYTLKNKLKISYDILSRKKNTNLIFIRI